jgi:hypothetical protein
MNMGIFGKGPYQGSAAQYTTINPFQAMQMTGTGSYRNRDIQGRQAGQEGWFQPPSYLDALMPETNAVPDGQGGYKGVYGVSPTIAAVQAMADKGLLPSVNKTPTPTADATPGKKKKKQKKAGPSPYELNAATDTLQDVKYVSGPKDWRTQYGLL